MVRFSLFFALFSLAACGVQGVEETERAQTEPAPIETKRTDTTETIVYRETKSDWAGGEAHEHGAAEMAVVIEGKTLTISLDAPLDNFGLQEGGETVDLKGMGFSEGMVELIGEKAKCTPSGSSVNARQSGDHGSLALEMKWTCKSVSSLTAVKLNAFERYPGGFEKVSAIILIGKRQISGRLTPESPTLLLN